MRKLIVVSVHPIHYNDYLFHEIGKSGIDITVSYVNKELANYPWKEKETEVIHSRRGIAAIFWV